MKDGISFHEEAVAQVVKQIMPPARSKLQDSLKFTGKFSVKHIRNGEVIEEIECQNLVTNAGKNNILDVHFHGGTQITTWYMGLVDNASFSAYAAGDTMASHAGWIENVDYDEAARPAWTEDAPASQAITNSSAVVFTMNATKTIKGLFLNSVATKSGTTGTLWCAVSFGSTVSVVDNDVLQVTYTLTVS